MERFLETIGKLHSQTFDDVVDVEVDDVYIVVITAVYALKTSKSKEY